MAKELVLFRLLLRINTIVFTVPDPIVWLDYNKVFQPQVNSAFVGNYFQSYINTHVVL